MLPSIRSRKWSWDLWVLSAIAATAGLATQTMADEMVVLRNGTAQLSIAVDGGGIVEFRFLDSDLNPLNWEISPELEPRPKDKPFLRGHFLCLDRWGRPSAAEEMNGVPFHGEAPRIAWTVLKPPKQGTRRLVAEMGCVLPLAGMRVKRGIRLAEAGSTFAASGGVESFTVSEAVTNTRKLGRIYNMVQHPSIAPPFLDDNTIVDTNASYGFVQESALPASRESAARWPNVDVGGQTVDLRRFKNSSPSTTGHDVSSFVFPKSVKFGWVTACNPPKRLLIGYVWKTQDYPWLNIWRYIYKGRVTARGLEFGTTGYHQPFPLLVRQGRILDRPLYEYIDAGQTIKKSYICFLAKIPADYQGVAGVKYDGGSLTLVERRKQNPRVTSLKVGELSND
jgi:hypothetical protein